MITSPKSLSRVDFAQPTEDPSYGKIKQLHNRWQEIHHEIDREKQSRRDSIEEQLQVLQERVAQKRQADQLRIVELRTHIDTVNEVVAGERADRRSYLSEREKQVKEIEAELSEGIEAERKVPPKSMQNIEAKEEQFGKQSDERILSVMEQLESMENENRGEMETCMAQARQKITELQATILQERKKRQEATTQVTESIEGDLNRLHNALSIQKKVREETQNKLYRMIEEVQKKLQEQLNTERRQRQQMNEAMLQLLQETCSKVQRHFR